MRKRSDASLWPKGSDIAKVESRTGAVTLASRWRLDSAFAAPASIRFGLALFPVPAHRTGQAELPHPALGKDARPIRRVTPSATSEQNSTGSFSILCENGANYIAWSAGTTGFAGFPWTSVIGGTD
jgi:hypothetical protein